MKKVVIISLYDTNNYGNRLQNCAVNNIAEKMGCIPETIVIKDDFFMGIRKKLWLAVYEDKIRRKKKKLFKLFDKKHNNIKKYSKRELKTQKFNQIYDYAFIGSDQIWSKYKITFGVEGFPFGSIVSPEKRITISPSFGGSKIPSGEEECYRKFLSELRQISVREKSGAEIIEDLIGKKATVLIDPVLALTCEEWEKKFDKKKYSNEDFALCCFLGGISEDTNEKIKKIISEKTIKKLYSNTPESSEGPDGFLSLIYNSKIVLTDSFHCTAFSILFKKPFVVFKRRNIEETQITRLNNLLEKFQLSDRYIENLDLEKSYLINFDESERILEDERKKFFDFLNLSLRNSKK